MCIDHGADIVLQFGLLQILSESTRDVSTVFGECYVRVY